MFLLRFSSSWISARNLITFSVEIKDKAQSNTTVPYILNWVLLQENQPNGICNKSRSRSACMYLQSDLDLHLHWSQNSQRIFQEMCDKLETLESYGMDAQTNINVHMREIHKRSETAYQQSYKQWANITNDSITEHCVQDSSFKIYCWPFLNLSWVLCNIWTSS